MKIAEFQKVMLKAKPGQHIRYFLGHLAASRETWADVNRIANYVTALAALGLARIYQKREGESMGYYIVLTERLKVRKDGQGSHQEAQRLMEIV